MLDVLDIKKSTSQQPFKKFKMNRRVALVLIVFTCMDITTVMFLSREAKSMFEFSDAFMISCASVFLHILILTYLSKVKNALDVIDISESIIKRRKCLIHAHESDGNEKFTRLNTNFRLRIPDIKGHL